MAVLNARAVDDTFTLLVVFHWVVAVFAALFSPLSLLYIGMGWAFLHGRFPFFLFPANVAASAHPPPAPPAFIGWFMLGIGTLFLLFALGYAVAIAAAAVSLSRRRHWMYCMVMAGLSCGWFPFGTALGVFTIVTLSRPDVRQLFETQAQVTLTG